MSWKLINEAYTGLDAAGGTEDTSYDLGYLFYDQAKTLVFRVGNTGSNTADYIVTASGQNSSINSAVEFSKDNSSWEDSVLYSGIKPNATSDTVYCRFTTPDDAYVNSGTFLIAITETER